MARPDLPALSPSDFARRIAALSPAPLSAKAAEALFIHYEELRRWNRLLSLVGPGTAEEVLGRHYGESLAAAPLLGDEPLEIVDLGSGAGFPGLVLAAALPNSRVTLVEAREKKWAFLEAVRRRAALPVRCLNVRVGPSLPAGLPERIDAVTVRALRLDPELMALLDERLPEEGRILLWVGGDLPALPPRWHVSASVALPESNRRRVILLRREAKTEAVQGAGA